MTSCCGKNVIKTILFGLSLAPFIVQADIFDARFSAAIGFDSNAYRAPSDDYVDFYADTTGSTTVSPDVQSGFFIPLSLDLSYDKKLDKEWRLITQYNFDGKTYLDNDLSNADQYSHKASIGAKYKIHNFKTRKSSIYAGAIMTDRQRTYYDRDTGLEKTTSTALDDVSDLYSYRSQGFEIVYDYWKKKDWSFNAQYRMEERDHASVPAGSEYDNDYTRLDLGFNYRINKTFRTAVDYSAYSYDYSFRHARNLSGQLYSSHPLLEYDYQKILLSLQHRLSSVLNLKYSYEMRNREDNYLGYNDYDMTTLALSLRYHPNDQYLLRAKISSEQRDYPNAWNFDRDPSLYPAITNSQHKSSDGTVLAFSADYQWDDKITLFGDIELSKNNNTDPRYDYDRNQLVVGLKIILD